MIKNIIFDFGGVLLDLDFHKTFKELSPIMGVELHPENLPSDFRELYLAFERGELKPETFLWNIQQLSAKEISKPHLVLRAWNAMLLGWNADRLPWLLEVKKTFHTYLLSNTNSLHIDWVLKDLRTNHGITDFESNYFDCIYYSHKMGMQKPDKNIYLTVLNDNGLIPSETLFIDDNADNIAGAREVGIQAVLHDPNLEIMEMLPEYIKSARV